jgi:hypothetical protein
MACEVCNRLENDLMHHFNYDANGDSILQSCNDRAIQGWSEGGVNVATELLLLEKRSFNTLSPKQMKIYI